MTNTTMRNLGLSLIFLALAAGSLGRTMHASGSVNMALNGLSVLFSLSAIVLFFKAAPANRRLNMIGVMVAALLACVVLALIVLRR